MVPIPKVQFECLCRARIPDDDETVSRGLDRRRHISPKGSASLRELPLAPIGLRDTVDRDDPCVADVRNRGLKFDGLPAVRMVDAVHLRAGKRPRTRLDEPRRVGADNPDFELIEVIALSGVHNFKKAKVILAIRERLRDSFAGRSQ